MTKCSMDWLDNSGSKKEANKPVDEKKSQKNSGSEKNRNKTKRQTMTVNDTKAWEEKEECFGW